MTGRMKLLMSVALGSCSLAAMAQPAVKAGMTAVDEIVVTARKRTENVQNVPIAVSAFSDEALARQQVVNITDLSLAVPNMLITQTGGSSNAAQIFIRGFGQDALGYNSETPVGVYFDDVYLGRSQGTLFDVLDVERVEILRGPQGTLYGRNATTGAVKVVLRRPDLENPTVRGDLTVGSYSRIDVRGAVSVPLIPGKLAGKVDFVSRNESGWLTGVDATGIENGLRANGISRQLIRGALAWQTSDIVRVDIAGDFSNDSSGAITGTPILCAAGANSVCTPRFGDPTKAGINFPGLQRFKTWGGSVKVTADLSFGELKSVTAYRGLNGFDPIDLSVIPGAPTPILYNQDQDQFSQELQLVSSLDGPLNYTAGLFFFQEKWATDTNFVNLRRNVDRQTANSYAAYGEIYYRIVEGFNLTLGGRITHDTKDINRQIFVPRTAAVPTVTLNPPGYSETVFTPKVALDWKASEDVLVYASWSRGYRPGGYGSTWPGNAVAAGGTFDAEKSNSFDAGIKSSWFENKLTLNLAAYHIRYTNLQQSQLTPTAFNVTSSDARVQGVEVELNARPIKGLLLTGNLGLMDNKITRSSVPGDNLSRKLRYAPDASWKIGAEYEVPVNADGASLFFGGNYARVSSTPMDLVNTLSLLMPAYGLLDARIGFREASNRYTVTLGARNLTDTSYWRSGVPGQSRFYAQPRTFLATFAINM